MRLAVICPNPALDVVTTVAAFELGEDIAGADATIRAGGKGTNVACVACDLGATATLVAPIGGHSGAAFAQMLDPRLLLERIAVGGPTRLCVTVQTQNSTSHIRGRGPNVDRNEWQDLMQAAQAAASSADAVVISGSFPPGIAASAVAELVASLACPRIYVDTSGPHLGVAAGLAGVTIAPNFEELCVLASNDCDPTGWEPADRAQLAAHLVAQLAHSHPARVLATLGEAGAGLLINGRWCLAVPPSVHGNPVGAGDATLAAFVLSELAGHSPQTALKRAVAAGAAAVAQPIAGRVDPEVVDSFEAQTTLVEFPADQADIKQT